MGDPFPTFPANGPGAGGPEVPLPAANGHDGYG